MNKTFKLKSLLLSMVVAGAATLTVAPATTQAGVSANVGFTSDYIFRGFQQANGGLDVYGGVDYEADNGLFVGVWATTMGISSSYEDEVEYDLYFGWGGAVEGVDLGIAYTNYSYTESYNGDMGAFEEVNLSAGYGPVSVGYDIGLKTDYTDKYDHYSISVDASELVEGVSLTYGVTTADGAEDADYFDVGYGTTVSSSALGDMDLGANIIFSGKDTDDATYFVVGMTKSFDLM